MKNGTENIRFTKMVPKLGSRGAPLYGQFDPDKNKHYWYQEWVRDYGRYEVH